MQNCIWEVKLCDVLIAEIMVLGHQSLLSSMSGTPPGLQPALQLAAVAAHLAPRSRPWAPFLQFGMPMFAPFLTRPHFGGHPQHNLLNISNMSNSTSNSSHSSSISSQRNIQSPPSEDSNDERGKQTFFLHPSRRIFFSNSKLNNVCGSNEFWRCVIQISVHCSRRRFMKRIQCWYETNENDCDFQLKQLQCDYILIALRERFKSKSSTFNLHVSKMKKFVMELSAETWDGWGIMKLFIIVSTAHKLRS